MSSSVFSCRFAAALFDCQPVAGRGPGFWKARSPARLYKQERPSLRIVKRLIKYQGSSKRFVALSFTSTHSFQPANFAAMSGRGKGKTAKKAVSRSSKAGLQFPVGRIARYLKKGKVRAAVGCLRC